MKTGIAGAAALALSLALAAQGHAAPDEGLQWQEMGPGSYFAPAFGNWEKEAHGKFIRLAPGLDVPFHIHSGDYHAVMISGRMTNLYEGGTSSEVGSGDYWNVPAGLPHGHKCVSEEPCLMYTHSGSAFDYVPHEGDRAGAP